MKQTVVEWLFDNLNLCFDKFDDGEYSYSEFMGASKEVKEQAKEMEKQQIINAYDLGSLSEMQYPNPKTVIENGEQYYNETFKSE